MTQLTRGALASVVQTTLTDIVVFQYNPAEITRTLKPRYTGYDDTQPANQASSDVDFSDAASQSISFTAEFDAADALQAGDATALQSGIAPQLAVLEKLIYPSLTEIDAAESNTRGGKISIVTAKAPGTLLVWGKNRVLPVRITSIAITETAFDAALNPLRASVVIGVDVQTYNNRMSLLDYGRFKAYHQKIELLAQQGTPSQDSTASLMRLLNR